MSFFCKLFGIIPFLIGFNAYSMTCKSAFQQPNTEIVAMGFDTRGLEKYEVSRLAALSGDLQRSVDINDQIRTKISTMKIAQILSGKYGTHGAFMAKLEDGTKVLIKPHSDDWYSSIPKEVGVSVFADMIGLPIVPVSGFRLDSTHSTPVSVHLVQKVDRFQQFSYGVRGLINTLQGEVSTKNLYGAEINFLKIIIGYSSLEFQPRHVLSQTIRGQRINSLIDLGSAFIDTGLSLHPSWAQPYMLSEATMQRIESLDKEEFTQKLAPYFPESVIDSLFLNTQKSVHAMRVLQRGDPKEIEDEMNSYKPVNYMVQKWMWKEALEPPQIAIDFNI